MNQTIGNGLNDAMATLNPPRWITTTNQMIDVSLANCLYATRATFHGSLHGSPGSLTFGCDMVLDVLVIADWLTIQQNRQQLIDQ